MKRTQGSDIDNAGRTTCGSPWTSEEASQLLSTNRRGFLHRSALVIGAFLVGLGRTGSASGVPTTYVVNCCSPCKSVTDCPCANGYTLDWECDHDGKRWSCVECFPTIEIKRDAGTCYNRTFCSQATCSRVEVVDRDQGGSAWERAWGELDDIGAGCRDPETGDYIMWSEPGTPCDNRDPVRSYGSA